MTLDTIINSVVGSLVRVKDIKIILTEIAPAVKNIVAVIMASRAKTEEDPEITTEELVAAKVAAQAPWKEVEELARQEIAK